MDLIRNYSYYMIWNKVFIFIVLSCVLHAGFFSLFYFYNGSTKDSYAQESMMVRIVGTIMPEKAGVPSPYPYPIKGGGIVYAPSPQAGEGPGEGALLSSSFESSTPMDGSPVPVHPQDEHKDDVVTEEPIHNTGGITTELSFSEISASGSKTGTENSDVDGLSTGDSSGGDNINGASIALSGSEASLQIQKALREIVLTNIRKNMIYPVAARKLGLEGDVNISFRIAPDGTVNNVSASSKKNDLSVLEKAAVSLIYKSAPYYLSGPKKMGEAVSIQMVISYRLEDEKR